MKYDKKKALGIIVNVAKKYDKMNYAEITAECARLSKEKANKKSVTKKTKIPCKTKFVI